MFNGMPAMGNSAFPNAERYRAVIDVLREQGFKPGDRIRVNGWQTFEEAAFAERARLSQYWMVRNDGSSGERLRCANHSNDQFSVPVYHAYLTLCCVNRPFRGLGNALYAYFKTRTESETRRSLTQGLPDLARRHPETARMLQPMQPGETLWAVILGMPEPITEQRAMDLLDEINSRTPNDPLVL